jgi:hypothetical protein
MTNLTGALETPGPDHTIDPDENHNLAMVPAMARVVTALSKQLRIGWRGAMMSQGNGH